MGIQGFRIPQDFARCRISLLQLLRVSLDQLDNLHKPTSLFTDNEISARIPGYSAIVLLSNRLSALEFELPPCHMGQSDLQDLV